MLKISSDFDGALGPYLSESHKCAGQFSYPSIPDQSDQNNKALLITLPVKPKAKSACEHRGEVTEADEQFLKSGQDLWYSFRFMFNAGMEGKIGRDRFVLAQLKQKKKGCGFAGNELSLLLLKDGNPPISVRVFEEIESKVVAIQLAVSSVKVIKIPVGHVLMRNEEFFGKWHQLILHMNLIAQEEEAKPKGGFVEGWVDGRPFAGIYGKVKGEPFGYPTFIGCNYFKFGIYGDNYKVPWNVVVDRFRRGPRESDVK
jgi:hypothetical protein